MKEDRIEKSLEALEALEQRLMNAIKDLRKERAGEQSVSIEETKCSRPDMRPEQALSLAVLGHNLVNQQASAAVLNLAVVAKAAGSILTSPHSDDALDEVIRRSAITQR